MLKQGPSAWCDSGGKKNPKLLYNLPMVSLPSVFSDTFGDKVTRSCNELLTFPETITESNARFMSANDTMNGPQWPLP